MREEAASGAYKSSSLVVVRPFAPAPPQATGTSGSTPSLPFLREPVDVLRNGLPALKESASTSHPVEDIVKAHAKVRGTLLRCRCIA